MWRLNSVPLSLKVPFLVVAMMVLVGFVASQQVLSSLNTLQAERIRELARQHVEALSVALGPHVLRNDIWEVYDTLNRAAGAAEGRRSVFSAVADEHGRILAATDPRRAPVDSPISGLSKGALSPEQLSVNKGAQRVKLVAPLVYQGRDVGQILTELDISDLLAERSRVRRFLLAGNTLATGLLALFGYLIARRMLAPISRLAARMRETEGAPRPISEADFAQGDAEIARLVGGYNDMVSAIAAKAEVERRLAERERFVSLGRLSSSLAHEINNPLGGLLNAADTIREYADRPEVVRQSAELLTRGLKHLRDVSKATLDQNRVDRSGLALSEEDFDDLRLLIKPEIARHMQTLDWQVDVDHDTLARFASAPVRQILLNLLLNATEAAGEGGAIGLSAQRRANALCLQVSDTGPGLTKAACERLLGTGRMAPGSGVGLRLVHDLAGQLDGHISLNRQEGKTTIGVDLPILENSEQSAC